MAYVKDDRSNLQTCAMTINLVVSCGDLDMVEPFDNFCFEYALSKVC